jgi:hypothetical protein
VHNYSPPESELNTVGTLSAELTTANRRQMIVAPLPTAASQGSDSSIDGDFPLDIATLDPLLQFREQ